MKYKILYDAANEITPFSLPFIIFCLFFIIAIIYSVRVWKNSNVGGKIGLVLVPAIMSIVLISQFVTFFQAKQVLENFTNGDYQIVEGAISGYEERYKVGDMDEEDYPDRFFVDDTEFVIYKDQAYGMEYCLRKADGSELKNGQNVKIYYSNFKYDNIILKIELEDKISD